MRRRLLDFCVAKLWVEVIPVPGKPRSATRRLHIVLRTAPDTAVTRDVLPDYGKRWKRFEKGEVTLPEEVMTQPLDAAISSAR